VLRCHINPLLQLAPTCIERCAGVSTTNHWACSEIRSRVLRSASKCYCAVCFMIKERHSSTSKHSGAYFRTRPLIDRRFADTGRTFRRRILGRFDDNPWTSLLWLSAGSTMSCGFESFCRLETWTARFRRLVRFRLGSSASCSAVNSSIGSSAVQSSNG